MKSSITREGIRGSSPFASTKTIHCAVVQLAEHLVLSQKVAGSSPVGTICECDLKVKCLVEAQVMEVRFLPFALNGTVEQPKKLNQGSSPDCRSGPLNRRVGSSPTCTTIMLCVLTV